VRRFAGALVAGLSAMAFAVGMSVPAAADGLDISHIVWLDVSKDPTVFTDSHRVYNLGSRVDDGCRWTLNLTRKPNEPTVGAQEIGRDTVSCVDVVRVGHVIKPPDPTGGSSASGQVSNGVEWHDPCSNEDFTWYDPLGIPLTEVRTYGCFAYTGQYVGSCTSSGDYRWWNSNTGWHETGYGGTWVSYNADDTQCFANTNDGFTHYAGTGCWSGTTYIYYQPNKLVMYGDGSVGDGTTSWASGACTNQLHFGSNL
jgi:hypothetical protein